jgi:glutamate racemase
MSKVRRQIKAQRIVVFDSGVGGLSVVGEIRRLMPDLAIDYVADDEFRPYGDKSEAALKARLPQLLRTIEIMLRPDAIVVACNTASVTALSAIRAAVTTPVIGVVPAIKPAARLTKTGRIGVLGTPGTVRRQYVDGLIQKFAAHCDVTLQGSVNLVEWAEQKLAGQAISQKALQQEITPFFADVGQAPIDVIVLACTHFPLLAEELRQSAPSAVQWIDSGSAIAKRVSVVLQSDGAVSSDKQATERREDIAFLIGPNADAARKAAFVSYGFNPVIGLKPV